MIRRLLPVALAGALIATTGAAAPIERPTAWCIPLFMSCDDPTPTPSPTPSPSASSVPGLPGLPDLGGQSPTPDVSPTPQAPAEPEAPVEAVPDETAPVFTQPPAQLGSDGLSISGLTGISLVTVPLADGTRTHALKISADSITITGFALTVGHAEGPALVTTADTMTLSGDVSVYLNSLTATGADGTSYTLGAETPPPRDGITPTLLRVTLGLVGATADSISYSNTDQRLTS
ncbi:hypothetical protein QE374_002764 [Microbacterium sp. SORGH_AS428]|uniref:hypothetical protein n=1 Tax=Microbacterium sp. SORGH_AS_0428 TaxID=3041788 RepID=UPI00285FB044|nr:hypothetical protein [Microbacterium sp. SORGH_AS_0428]MDR6200855.1 hypothetical protein [Microbacterium sp. SORGH_AS_0428]